MLNRLVWNELLSWRRNLLPRNLQAPSRRDLFVDAVYRHIEEHGSLPTRFILDVFGWWLCGMDSVRTEALMKEAHAEILEVTDAKKRKVTEIPPNGSHDVCVLRVACNVREVCSFCVLIVFCRFVTLRVVYSQVCAHGDVHVMRVCW